MTRAIGCDGPGRIAGVIHFGRIASALLRETDCASVVGQRVRVRAEHVRDSIDRLEVVGRRGDDDEFAGLELEAVGKLEVDVAADAPAGQVLENRAGVIDFDEFEVLPVGKVLPVIHDFAEDQPRRAARRAERLTRGCERAGGRAHRRADVAELDGRRLRDCRW